MKRPYTEQRSLLPMNFVAETDALVKCAFENYALTNSQFVLHN